MTRKEFLRLSSLLGIQISILPTYGALPGKPTGQNAYNVLIIGSGAAGLSAGYLLKQQGINFKILEAAPHHGGRMKKTDTFADFPIPLGAEWLTVSTGELDRIVNDPSVPVNVPTVGYHPHDPYGIWGNGKLLASNLESFHYRKFVGATWFDFFQEYVVPSIAQNIVYNEPVHAIDYEGPEVTVSTPQKTYSADKVIVTVPLKMLQRETIAFTPALPKRKQRAIEHALVWDGIKVFLAFSEKFYPAFVDFQITPKTAGQVSYFDAAYGQRTSQHVLGLFAVGEPAQNYLTRTGDDLKDYILQELDEMFSGQATPKYLKHIVQNWSKEPYIEGAYLHDHESPKVVRTLQESVSDRIYFAGDSYTSGNDWGGVHTAAQAAKEAVDQILS